MENEAELFYEGDFRRSATISTSISEAHLRFDPKQRLGVNLDFGNNGFLASVDEKQNIGSFPTKGLEKTIRAYKFNPYVPFQKGHAQYLIPPFGQNLLSIIENYPSLKKDVTRLFADYNLEIAFDRASQTIKILKKKKDDIFLISYNSVADSLQRIIFFKAAIVSNQDSVLLFEEPEAHSFPPYMAHLTQEMIANRSNQYFMVTHSPFILNDLLENAREELAIYNVDFKDKQTLVKLLSEKDLHEVYQYGVDLFTNNESYL